MFPEDKRLHVIFGPNEAGKSTCMRALRGLFLGIMETTQDDFLHESKHLRVGGILLSQDGKRLSIVRRKGRKDTLLGPDGKPIPEGVMKSFLGGVDGETFIRVFGMGRDELVSGGRAIMEGKGALGESLFAAGLGGANLKSLLETFESEAQALFKPAGANPRLNAEAKTYRELKNRIRDLSLPPSDWEKLEAEVSSLEETSIEAINDARGILAEVRPDLTLESVGLLRLTTNTWYVWQKRL